MIPHALGRSQSALRRTPFEHRVLGCMVAVMLGAVRWIQLSIVTLMTVSLLFGVYGFDGAIHSVHHLLASDALRQQDVDDSEDDHGTSAADPEQACHVAAAASHAAATLVDVLPVVDPASMDARLLLLATVAVPRLGWTDLHRGRAPPASRPLSR